MDVGYIGLGSMGGSMAMKAIRGGHRLVVHDNRRERRLRYPSNAALAWIQVYAMDQTFDQEEGDYTVTTDDDGQIILERVRPQNPDANVTLKGGSVYSDGYVWIRMSPGPAKNILVITSSDGVTWIGDTITVLDPEPETESAKTTEGSDAASESAALS